MLVIVFLTLLSIEEIDNAMEGIHSLSDLVEFVLEKEKAEIKKQESFFKDPLRVGRRIDEILAE